MTKKNEALDVYCSSCVAEPKETLQMKNNTATQDCLLGQGSYSFTPDCQCPSCIVADDDNTNYNKLLKLEPSNLCPSCGCKPACLPENYYMPEDGVYFECMNEDCEVVYVENEEWSMWQSEMTALAEEQ